MKLLTSALSVAGLLSTLCAGLPALETSNGAGAIFFANLATTPMQVGQLPEKITIPEASAATDGYILFKARLPFRDTKGFGFTDWVLLATKYDADGLFAPGSPAYLLGAKPRGSGKWLSDSRTLMAMPYVKIARDSVERYLPIAWIPEKGVEGMIAELVRVPVDDLPPSDEVESKNDWVDRVIYFLRNGQQ
ncbi:MAG: hypothetical protein M1829_002891 [Trizodia sp. TS-e1964]|nr:MAG: hypothetical protein M1829_002891 [Trizodia sp. TS-e1964]